MLPKQTLLQWLLINCFQETIPKSVLPLFLESNKGQAVTNKESQNLTKVLIGNYIVHIGHRAQVSGKEDENSDQTGP